MAWRFGGLAQLGERLPCKQEVSGSIPLISTKENMGPELSWLERTTDNRKVGGSSPLGPTKQRFAVGSQSLRDWTLRSGFKRGWKCFAP